MQQQDKAAVLRATLNPDGSYCTAVRGYLLPQPRQLTMLVLVTLRATFEVPVHTSRRIFDLSINTRMASRRSLQFAIAQPFFFSVHVFSLLRLLM